MSRNFKLMRQRLPDLLKEHGAPSEQKIFMRPELSVRLLDMVADSNEIPTMVLNAETVIDALDIGKSNIEFMGDSANKKAIANYLNINYNEVKDMIDEKISNDMNIVGNPPFNDVQGDARKESANTNNSNIYERCINSAIKVCKTGQIAFVIPLSFMYAPSLESLKDNLINHGLKEIHELDSEKEFPDVAIRAGVGIVLSEAGYTGDIKIHRLDGTSFDIKRGSRLHFGNPTHYDILDKIPTTNSFWDSSTSGDYDTPTGSKGSLERVIELSNGSYCESSSSTHNTEVLIYGGREGKDNGKYLWSDTNKAKGRWGVAFPKMSDKRKLGRIMLVHPNQGVHSIFRVVYFDTEEEARNAMAFWSHPLFAFAVKLVKFDDTVNKEKNSFCFFPMVDFTKQYNKQDVYDLYGIKDPEINDINTYIETN